MNSLRALFAVVFRKVWYDFLRRLKPESDADWCVSALCYTSLCKTRTRARIQGDHRRDVKTKRLFRSAGARAWHRTAIDRFQSALHILRQLLRLRHGTLGFLLVSLDVVQIAPILLVRFLLQAVLDGFDALVDLAPAATG